MESLVDEHDPDAESESDKKKERIDVDLTSIFGDPYKTAVCLPSKEEFRRLNWRAVIFGVAWWFCCFYIDTIVQVVTEHIENRTYPMSEESENYARHHFFSESYELFDLGFAIFPPIKDIIADIYVVAFVVISIIRFLLTRNRFVVLKRYCLLLGTVFLFRALTIVSTILPQPQRSCIATANAKENPFLGGLMIMLTLQKTCTDMFFSGHATNLTFAALLWTNFSHIYPVIPLTKLDKAVFRGLPLTDRFGRIRRPTVTKIIVWLAVIVGFIFISATRLHYMIDVIFGFCVSLTVFILYHHALAKACTNNSFFSRFLRWYESDSPEIELGKRLIDSYPILYADFDKDDIDSKDDIHHRNVVVTLSSADPSTTDAVSVDSQV